MYILLGYYTLVFFRTGAQMAAQCSRQGRDVHAVLFIPTETIFSFTELVFFSFPSSVSATSQAAHPFKLSQIWIFGAEMERFSVFHQDSF